MHRLVSSQQCMCMMVVPMLLRCARQQRHRRGLSDVCGDAQSWARFFSGGPAGPTAGAQGAAEPHAVNIRIDRSGLFQPREHSHDVLPHKEPETPMGRHLKSLIKVRRVGAQFRLLTEGAPEQTGPEERRAQYRGGPITLAEYISVRGRALGFS